jgi:phosphoglycolate phosphatase-like HAD superfamily hydrolase
MSFLNTILEWEGPIVDIRPRFLAAHGEAIRAIGYEGPPEDEVWRLYRLNSPDATMIRFGKAPKVAEYSRIRSERLDSTDLMALDELQPLVVENLKVLKNMGACHLVSLSANRDGINATLNRLDVWLYFEQKRPLPQDRERRVEAIKQLTGGHHRTLAVAGTVSFAFAAGEAGCRVVGIKSGPCFPKLLRQVGVDVFYENLDELTDALARRDPELQRIGIC